MNIPKSFFIYLIFSFLIKTGASAQVSSGSYTIDENTIVYDKQTGKRLKYIEITDIIRTNKNISFEKKINERGEIESMTYDAAGNGRVTRDISLRTKPNEEFPSFIVKTTEGNVLTSKELRGKFLVLYFNLYLKSPFTSPKELADFESLINTLRSKDKIIPILFTHSDVDDIKEFTDQAKVSFPIVPEARNFMNRFLVTNFPSFVVVNQNGTLLSYAEDLTEVKELLKKL